jgi:hypothetical protein
VKLGEKWSAGKSHSCSIEFLKPEPEGGEECVWRVRLQLRWTSRSSSSVPNSRADGSSKTLPPARRFGRCGKWPGDKELAAFRGRSRTGATLT